MGASSALQREGRQQAISLLRQGVTGASALPSPSHASPTGGSSEPRQRPVGRGGRARQPCAGPAMHFPRPHPGPEGALGGKALEGVRRADGGARREPPALACGEAKCAWSRQQQGPGRGLGSAARLGGTAGRGPDQCGRPSLDPSQRQRWLSAAGGGSGLRMNPTENKKSEPAQRHSPRCGGAEADAVPAAGPPTHRTPAPPHRSGPCRSCFLVRPSPGRRGHGSSTPPHLTTSRAVPAASPGRRGQRLWGWERLLCTGQPPTVPRDQPRALS